MQTWPVRANQTESCACGTFPGHTSYLTFALDSQPRQSPMQQLARSTPPRRAKRLSSPAPQPRPILPKHVLQSSEPPLPSSPPPRRRGRKPAPLSRSAREAQRRLNHSIIEKARRTKINNALATLKELVPLDYGGKAKSQDNNDDNNNNSDDDDDNGDDGDDGEYGADRKKPIKRKSGKKEEKGREYKLEILVRTVAFMQDLLQRIAILEQANPLCSKCSGVLPTESQCDPTTMPESEPSPPSKRARIESYDTLGIPSPHQSSPPDHLLIQNRLPSISSWLPGTLDLSTLSPRNNGDWVSSGQLPTPPSSTQVRPAITSAHSSRRKISSSSPLLMRTPEEEHAATMLLQISASSSPPFRPLPPSVMSSTESLHHILPLATTSATCSSRKTTERRYDLESMGIQTPSSLLGLDQA